MAKLNYKYGRINDNGELIYAPYRLHYHNTYVINARESKYRECGYYPIKFDSVPQTELKDNEYWDTECEYINADDEQTKYIKVTYVIKTFE